MFIIFQWDIGGGKNKYVRLQANMENNNILLSVDNACLWVLYFCISLEISLDIFQSKSFLHCIFIVACETIPVNYLLELDRVYMFVCERVFMCTGNFNKLKSIYHVLKSWWLSYQYVL